MKGIFNMKKIYIFSDTHGNTDECINILYNAGKADAIIHAGDYVRDADDIHSVFPEIPMYSVRGNCDWYANEPNDMTVIIDDVKIFITHGHDYDVKNTLSQLKRKGIDINADLVIFGHTHKPMVDTDGVMTVVNPGSSSYNGTYAVVKIENKKIRADIFNI